MNKEVKKIQSFRDLDAWKEGHTLVMGIYEVTKGFPKEEVFGLVTQLRRAAVSFTSNIAEGFSRKSYKEKVQFYYTAVGSLTEIQNQILIAKDLGFMSPKEFSQLNDQSTKVHKITNGLISKSKTFFNNSPTPTSKFQIPSSKFKIPPSKTLSFVTALVVLSLIVLGHHTVEAQVAQSAPPQITSVSTSFNANSATVSFTIDSPAGGCVAYDATGSHSKASLYAKSEPLSSPSCSVYKVPAATSHSISLTGLDPSTTYHYRVEVNNANGTTDSTDRSFTTPPGAGGNQLVINIKGVTCTDTACDIEYGTTTSAKVQIRWDTSPHGDITQYPAANDFTETNLATGNRTARINGLTANTTYFYRLLAVGPGGQFPTGDLKFGTSANGRDHIFTTGQCSDGTPLNSCSVSGEFCTANGTLDRNCSQCGFNCANGSTCSVGGACVGDPALNGSPFQCNNSVCYSEGGTFLSNAPAGCYASWPKCNANTILKVKKDRGCNLWLTCGTGFQTEPTQSGPAENLCLTLAACNSLSQNGQCNKYLPSGQCSNNPVRFCSTNVDCEAGGQCIFSPPGQPDKALQDLTFSSPAQISQIANLSGNVIAGLDWIQQGGANILQGYLPWQLMRQIGGNAELTNGDFEQRPPEKDPWVEAPLIDAGLTHINIDFEDRDAGPNHILHVQPAPSRIVAGVSLPVDFSGVASKAFTTSPDEFYYAEARIRSKGGTPVIRLQFGFNDYKSFRTSGVGAVDTFVDVTATSAWQRVTLGPINKMFGNTRVAVVCADTTTCTKFDVDDVQVRPVLQINTNPSYLTPSCRLYPKADAPACDYIDQNNITYKGWHGYCLEHDSQTGTCLSWWPVDILKGETNVFGADKADGYDDRVPLYFCAESSGTLKTSEVSGNGASPTTSDSYVYGDNLDSGHTFTINDRTMAPVPPTSSNIGHVANGLPIGAISGIDGYGFTNDPRTWITYFHFDAADFQGKDNNGVSVVISKPIATGDGSLTITLRASSPSPTDVGLPADHTVWQIDTDRSGSSNPDACKPGSTALNGEAPGPNCIYILLDFDGSGLLQSYRFDGADQEGQDVNSAQYDILFQVKELCTKIVQVVTPEGSNTAFAARVKSSTYTVDKLGYIQSSDLQPFGGMLQPATFPDNPGLWGPIGAEKQNTTSSPIPGQSRAGSPYVCTGNCSTYTCIVKNPHNTVVDRGLLAKVTTGTFGCNNAAGKTPADCQNIDSDDVAGGDGQCVGTSIPTAEKVISAQEFDTQCISGFCQGQTTNCSASSKQCTATASISATSTSASGATAAALAKCKTLTACQGTVETSSGTSCGTDVKYSGYTPQGSANCVATVRGGCTPGAFPGRCSCISNGTCTSGATYQQGILFGAACTADTQCRVAPDDFSKPEFFAQQRLRRLFGRSYAIWSWSNHLYSYRPLPGAGWLPPTTICSVVPRVFPDDFCAVPPRVFCPDQNDTTKCKVGQTAEFLNGGDSVTITGGSGSVGIKFNTDADPEQVPLKTVAIDWGDSPTPDQFAFPFAPRNDPNKPHILSHVYVCAGGVTCPPFEIKIQVIDNWSWCNDAAGATPCHAIGSWQKTGLKVIVQP